MAGFVLVEVMSDASVQALCLDISSIVCPLRAQRPFPSKRKYVDGTALSRARVSLAATIFAMTRRFLRVCVSNVDPRTLFRASYWNPGGKDAVGSVYESRRGPNERQMELIEESRLRTSLAYAYRTSETCSADHLCSYPQDPGISRRRRPQHA